MYAITSAGFRAVTAGELLAPGETLVELVPEEVLAAIKRAAGRGERDRLLRACDWTQTGDSPLDTLSRQAWAAYRSALRALPAAQGFPDCAWPSPPALPAGAADAGDFGAVGNL